MSVEIEMNGSSLSLCQYWPLQTDGGPAYSVLAVCLSCSVCIVINTIVLWLAELMEQWHTHSPLLGNPWLNEEALTSPASVALSRTWVVSLNGRSFIGLLYFSRNLHTAGSGIQTAHILNANTVAIRLIVWKVRGKSFFMKGVQCGVYSKTIFDFI